MELELSSCNWLTADEKSFCSAVVKHSEYAKETFLHYNLRYLPSWLPTFSKYVSGKDFQTESQMLSIFPQI